MYKKKYYSAPGLNKGAPPFTKSELKHAVMVAKGSGRTPERDAALILCSATMGLRVSEIGNLEIRHIMHEDGSYLIEGWLPGEFAKSGKSAAIFPVNKKFQDALDAYIDYRLKKRHIVSDDKSKYRGLRPDSKVFLTETGRKFAMTNKIRKRMEGKREIVTEYKACDVLERAFKRFYCRAFGDETDFSSHSGRKYFALHLARLVEKKQNENEGYEDVITLMRSHNLTSIQPYLAPTKDEIMKEIKRSA